MYAKESLSTKKSETGTEARVYGAAKKFRRSKGPKKTHAQRSQKTKRLMLSRKNRLHLKNDFGRIRTSGKTYDSPSFGLLVSFSDKQQEASAAFIVSKKVDKRSVVRHEVKRKLSDAIKPFLPRLVKNTELVFLAKQKAIEATPEQLKSEIESVLKRARLL